MSIAAPTFKFQHVCRGARVWWGLGEIRKQLLGDTKPSVWIYDWWWSWAKHCERFGLEIPHMRFAKACKRSSASAAAYDIYRSLQTPTVSSYALVLILMRLSKAQTGQGRQDKIKSHVALWSVFARSLIRKFSRDGLCEWVLMLDTQVVVRPGLPIAGASAVSVPFHNGCVDLRQCQGHPNGNQVVAALGAVSLHEVDVLDLMMCTSRVSLAWFCKQLLWHVGEMIDANVAQADDSLEGVASRPQASLVRSAPMTTQAVWYRRQQEGSRNLNLIAYLFASRRLFSTHRGHVGFAFDASRVGGLSRLLGIGSVGNIVTWFPPQAPP